MLLEGHGRKREPTGIRHDAKSAKVRKANREAAEDIYHERMRQLARAKFGLPIATGTTFDKWADWYETHKVARQKSPSRVRAVIVHLRAHFGPLALADIKPARWDEYETTRAAAGAKPNTILLELKTLKAMLNVAVMNEQLEVNPLVHVKRHRSRLPPKRTLTKADEDRLLEQLRDPEMRDLYLVAAGTLLRQVNVITLRRRQLQGSRLVVETKTGPHQLALDGPTVLQRRAAMVLKRRLPKTADGCFFPKWQAKFTANRDRAHVTFLGVFRRACGRANIPWGLRTHGVVWHTATRASGATRMIREHGIDIRTVQLLGGWSSLDQMAEYLGLDLSAGKHARPGARRSHRV